LIKRGKIVGKDLLRLGRAEGIVEEAGAAVTFST
jgi:hypothetical protein